MFFLCFSTVKVYGTILHGPASVAQLDAHPTDDLSPVVQS